IPIRRSRNFAKSSRSRQPTSTPDCRWHSNTSSAPNTLPGWSTPKKRSSSRPPLLPPTMRWAGSCWRWERRIGLSRSWKGLRNWRPTVPKPFTLWRALIRGRDENRMRIAPAPNSTVSTRCAAEYAKGLRMLSDVAMQNSTRTDLHGHEHVQHSERREPMYCRVPRHTHTWRSNELACNHPPKDPQSGSLAQYALIRFYGAAHEGS